MLNKSTSQALFASAQNFIPGGVNSPVRAFKAVGGEPLFIREANGAYMIDEDGNKFVDFINSWGPMILGHNPEIVQEAVQEAVKKSLSFGAPTRREVEIAELICSLIPSVEKVRMVNSGTEATMSAIRVARGFTGREKIIKFEGCYHGHGDSFLIAAGSGAATFGIPNSPGVTEGTAKDTLTAKYNDIDSVRKLFVENKGQIACLILEPVAGNMGCVLPEIGFLESLRQICDEYGALLIFDEVMTGFRLSIGGAQEVFGVKPDLSTFGKIIGGGMPVGAYGGRKDVMDFVSPQGPVYQAGTLSGNPVAMAAGYAMLSYLDQNRQVYQQLKDTTHAIVDGLANVINELQLPLTINQIGSMFTLFFTSERVINFEQANNCNQEKFSEFFNGMLERGFYLAPSQFESVFVSTAITPEIVNDFVMAGKELLAKMYSKEIA